MGDKDFIKPVLERRGTVHFGKAGPYSTLYSLLTLLPCLPVHAMRTLSWKMQSVTASLSSAITWQTFGIVMMRCSLHTNALAAPMQPSIPSPERHLSFSGSLQSSSISAAGEDEAWQAPDVLHHGPAN